VESLVQRRLGQVSEGARETITVAAVAGRRFDFGVLQALVDCDEHDLLARIKELIAAQLVVEESADRFAFRHALTKDAVGSWLLVRERRALHLAVAGTIERLNPHALEPYLADLAGHYFEGEAWEEALTYGRRAGEKALQLYAPHAAIEQFSRALVAADLLLRGRGRAFETLGDFDAARADNERALTQARKVGDNAEVWESLLALGLLWSGRDYRLSQEYLQQALDTARALGQPLLVAQSLNRVGNWHLNAGQGVSEAERHHREALVIFERLGDRQGIAETLDLLGMTRSIADDSYASHAYYVKSIDLCREIGDRQRLITGLAMQALNV
jgi:tetratricopeptide (TPR) repeat protein